MNELGSGPLFDNPITAGKPENNRRLLMALLGAASRPAKGLAATTGMADPSVAPWLQSSIIPEKYNHPYGTPPAEIERAQDERIGQQMLGFVGNIAKVGPIKIVNRAAGRGALSSEDFQLHPGRIAEYRAPAMLHKGKVIEGAASENHALIAERFGFPKGMVPGFVTKNGEFHFQFPSDIPTKAGRLKRALQK